MTPTKSALRSSGRVQERVLQQGMQRGVRSRRVGPHEVECPQPVLDGAPERNTRDDLFLPRHAEDIRVADRILELLRELDHVPVVDGDGAQPDPQGTIHVLARRDRGIAHHRAFAIAEADDRHGLPGAKAFANGQEDLKGVESFGIHLGARHSPGG